MPSPADLAFWLLTTLVEAFVVYLFARQGLFRRFPFLTFYFLILVTTSIARCAILFRFGLFSIEYAHFYFTTDVALSVSLLLSLSELNLRIGRSDMLRSKIVTWVGVTLLVVACFGVVLFRNDGMTKPFLRDSSESVFVPCGFAAVLMWVWTLRKNPADDIAARFVSVFAIYFLLFFLDYGVREMSRSLYISGLPKLPWMMNGWLALGSGFALVPKEHRVT